MGELDPIRNLLFKDERSVYPNPRILVEAALTKLEPDGSLICFDDELNEYFTTDAPNPIILDALSTDLYARHLSDLIGVIEGNVISIAQFHNLTDRILENLAQFLSNYRDNPEFIVYAASTIEVQEGVMNLKGIPTTHHGIWVPQLREQLKTIS